MVLITKKNWGGWWVQSVNAWPWITVDNTDPTNPIVSAILSSNLTLYSTTAASDIPWYSKIVTDIDDPDYDEPAVNVPIWPITWSDQLVWELATSAWLIVGNPWILTITTLWEIRRTGGSGTAEFYFKVFHRDSWGTETEIAISNNTMPLSNTVYAQFSTSALLNNGAFDSTDRIVIKYYATKVWWWSDPEYEFKFGWENPVRTLFPIPTSVALNDYSKIERYVSVTNDQTISVSNFYWVTNSNSNITLTLNDGTSEWEILTVKKLDDTDYSVFVNTSSLIDWEETIEISMEWESYDFYWTGSTFIIK